MTKEEKDKFIKLTSFDSGEAIYLEPEDIKEIICLAKTEKYTARTRVVTIRNTHLVREAAELIHIMIISKRKLKKKRKLWPSHNLCWPWSSE